MSVNNPDRKPLDSHAVIFDMDGVLVDAEVHWRALGPEYLATIDPGWSEQDQRSIHGMSIERVHRHLTDQYDLRLTRDELLERYEQLAHRIYSSQCALVSGVRELIAALVSSGAVLAVASSAPRRWIDIVLERFELRAIFSAIVGAEDVNGEVKPSPAIYRVVLERLRLPAQRVVAIEDSAKGVASARAAGVRCVAVGNGFNVSQDLSGADAVFPTLSALDPAVIIRLAGAVRGGADRG